MKKLLIAIALIASLSITGYAASGTVTVVVPTAVVTNLMDSLPGGAAVVKQITLLSTATTSGKLSIYDTPNGNIMYTNTGYTLPVTYVTNVISTYTNYFGATNSITNVALIHTTSTVASNIYSYPLRFVGQAGTNASATFDGNWTFTRGVYATNTTIGGGAVTVTLTYER